MAEKKQILDSTTGSKTKTQIETAAVKALANVLKDTDLTEIEYESHGLRIRVARQGIIQAPIMSHMPVHSAPLHSASTSMAPLPTSAHPSPQEKPAVSLDNHPGAVRSPMVGTAYTAPKPGADPFIREGDMVTEGQTVLIIEAMKVMNPIKAPKAGKVIKIMIQDAHPVEFDETLLVIE